MEKPRVFISSTIYDFKDLRSAIKYFLEENNFEVVTSENATFENPNKKNSYEACLDAIETCDYFVLLIGSRIGGKYKYIKADGKTEQITITRAEYRKAYTLFKQGKIRIINFVRKEIYDVKEDRKGLEQVLLKLKIKEEDKSPIKEHESKIIKDAGEIFRFLEEVGKNAEMKAAIELEWKEYPSGNWIYQFESFNDIVTVLKNSLNIKRELGKQIVYENIKNELIKNLTILTEKNNGEIYNVFSYAEIDKKKLVNSRRLLITGNELYRLFDFFFIYSGFADALSNRRLIQALDSDVFFEYDKSKKRFVPNRLHKFVTLLSEKIDKAKTLYAGLQAQKQSLIQFNETYHINTRRDDRTLHDVDPLQFTFLINLPYVFDDIYELSKQFLLHYKDNEYIPKIKQKIKTTVFSETAKGIEKRKVTIKDIEKIMDLFDGEDYD